MKKIVLLDLCSGVCLSFSGVAYSIFYPKYTEIIFGLSASQSNGLIGKYLTSESSSFERLFQKNFWLSGYFSVFGRSVAVLSLGICMSKFKPLPRTLIQCSILLQGIAAALLSLLLFLGCPQQRMHGHLNKDSRLVNEPSRFSAQFNMSRRIKFYSWSLTEDCNKNLNCEQTKYSPVCQVDEQVLYFSPCHAGCLPVANSNIPHVKSFHFILQFRNCP